MPAVPGAAKKIEVLPSDVTSTAHTMAGEVAQCVPPGPVPAPSAGSPIDAAMRVVAVAVSQSVTEASAELAPEPVEGVTKAETATTELRTQDGESAADIRSVAQSMAPMPPPGSSGGGAPSVRMASSDPGWHWEYDDNGLMIRVDDFEPLDPGGAAGGGFGGVAPI